MSNIIIPAEHQSSPKQTEMQKVVKQAATEYLEGGFAPELKSNVFGKRETEFWDTGLTGILAQHPRVQEALQKLQTQVQDKTNVEYQEKAEQLHELNAFAASGEQWPNQWMWQGQHNRQLRMVNIMSPKEFIEKLRKAGVRADFVPTVTLDYKADAQGIVRGCEVEHSDAKICLGRKLVRGCIGVFANVRGEYRYISKLQYPCGIEWTIMRFDEYNVPTNAEYQGWRSAVLNLITQGVITERTALKAFGPVPENPASLFYRQQLAEYRNGAGDANAA